MQKGDKIWLMSAKDCSDVLLQIDWSGGRDKSRAGRMLGDWYKAGDR